MGYLKTFTGNFDTLIQNNRIQITTNSDRDKMYISWIDTDFPYDHENKAPNIFARGFKPFPALNYLTVDYNYADLPFNVTLFYEGMWKTNLATAAKYSLNTESDGNIIPYIYIEMDTTDPSQIIQFKYVQDFSVEETDWPFEWNGEYLPCGWVGIKEQTSEDKLSSVLGNSPNPFHNETTIEIELYKTSKVKLVVTSISGQQMFEQDFGKLNQGRHDLELNFNYLSPGIYFYTVITQNNSATNKIVVE
jgi:Secretion system C-terminal sorting domain